MIFFGDIIHFVDDIDVVVLVYIKMCIEGGRVGGGGCMVGLCESRTKGCGQTIMAGICIKF